MWIICKENSDQTILMCRQIHVFVQGLCVKIYMYTYYGIFQTLFCVFLLWLYAQFNNLQKGRHTVS